MAPLITNPAQVVNLSLARMGRPERIGNLYEGSKFAKAALAIYGQTRDSLLREGNYGFAERNINAVLLKSAPVGGYTPGVPWNGPLYPPPPWNYEYQYPSDCLQVRNIKPIPIFVQNYDPQPHTWTVENDQFFTPAQKVILTNVQSAQLVYTAQVTDPQTWESDFVETFAAALARRLAGSNPDMAKMAAADEGQAMATAEGTEG
jgi:hypothetical protein